MDIDIFFHWRDLRKKVNLSKRNPACHLPAGRQVAGAGM